VAIRDDLTPQEAEGEVKRPRCSNSIKRASKLEQSDLTWNRQLEVEGIGAEWRPKGKAKRNAIILVLKDLQKFFGPMEKIIAIKRYDEDTALQAAKDFMLWKNSCDEGRTDEDYARLGLVVDQHLHAAMNKWRAFESKGEAQGKWIAAADYADQWFKDRSMGTEFNVYYICGGAPCNMEGGTIILSKKWKRFFEDPMAFKQRWYCKKCNTRYKTTFGVLCEMVMPEGGFAGAGPPVPHYCRAEFPFQGTMDAKAMKIEEVFSAAKTPEDLFNLIPSTPPMGVGSVLAEWPNDAELWGAMEKQYPGHYHFTNDMKVRSLPLLDWNIIFSLVGPETAKGAVQMCKAMNA